jgi:hypothetical protein
MPSIGVLLVSEHRSMLSEIVRRVLADAPELTVSGELVGDAQVERAVERTGADAVVWFVEPGAPSAGAVDLLVRHPRVRVITVEGDGRRGFLWEMRPNREPLGELAPHVLIAALRGSERA